LGEPTVSMAELLADLFAEEPGRSPRGDAA
jgi:hypothetical protein